MTKDVIKSYKRSFTDAADLRERCKQYFVEWEKLGRPLTVIGLAVYLDVSRQTLNVYESGEYDTPNNSYSDTIKKAKDYIECMKLEGALCGRYDKTVAIFDLKVNHKCIEHEKTIKPVEEDKEETEEITLDDHEIDILNRFGVEIDEIAEGQSTCDT